MVLILLLKFCSIISYGESNGELGQLYLDEAFYKYEKEEFDSSELNLDKALSFSEQHSELWYLKGIITEKKGNRFQALEFYRKSIDLEDKYSQYFYDLQFRYIRLLNIMGDHKEVLSFYNTHSEVLSTNNDILLMVSDSSFKYGFLDLSVELASHVYKKDPHTLKALLYLIHFTKNKDYYHNIIKNIDNFKLDKNDEITFQNIIINDSEYIDKSVLSIYKDLFGETPFYQAVLGIESESIQSSKNLLIRTYGNDLLKDGVYFGDHNFDGISDEIISLNGEEFTYLKDENQDNISDFSINFVNDRPTNIFFNEGSINMELVYTEYPFLKEIHYSKGAIKRIYKIFPGVKYTPLLNDLEFFWKSGVNISPMKKLKELNPIKLLSMSYSFVEFKDYKKTVFREYLIFDSEIKEIKEDSQLNGVFDHFLKIEAWKVEEGRRDINEDGLIDLYEYYENGDITGVAVDWNNNGKAEYLEDWSLLDVKTWDFNEDYYIDAEIIDSKSGNNYTSVSLEKNSISYEEIFSWDFTYKKFWFNNY